MKKVIKSFFTIFLISNMFLCLIPAYALTNQVDFKTKIYESQSAAVFDVIEKIDDESYKIKIIKALRGSFNNNEMQVKCNVDDHQLIVGERYISYFSNVTDPSGNVSVYCNLSVYETKDALIAPGYTATGFNSIDSFVYWIENFNQVFTAKSISIGDNHALAIDVNNKLWAWGSNAQGQLGVALSKHYSYKTSEAPILAMNNVIYAASGANHSLVIDKDGNLWGFGANGCGQLALSIKKVTEKTGVSQVLTNGEIGPGDFREKPVKIMSDVKQVAAGDRFSMALKSDGSVWTWGLGENGRLGNGKSSNSCTPKKVLSGIAKIYCSSGSAFAIAKNGTLYSWGENNCGQLGINNYKNSLKPAKVISCVKELSVGKYHTFAVKTNGMLYGWGSNSEGQLNVKSSFANKNYAKPTKLMNNVKEIVAGSNFSVYIDSSNVLYYCGSGLTVLTQQSNLTKKASSIIAYGVEDVFCGNEYIIFQNKDNVYYQLGRVSELSTSISEPTIISFGGYVDINYQQHLYANAK